MKLLGKHAFYLLLCLAVALFCLEALLLSPVIVVAIRLLSPHTWTSAWLHFWARWHYCRTLPRDLRADGYA